MSQSKTVISFENVTKIYTLYKNSQAQFMALFRKSKNDKEHKALKDVNLEIKRGESVGIVGRNGAGKSTLLKMITGVTFPTTGTVKVEGRVAALLELTAGFSPEMTGRENIYLKGYLLGLSDAKIAEIEEDIVDFADLEGYIDQPVRTYSSGMRMRLGFAINISTEPEILLVDEALSVGDASFKAKCLEKIHELIGADTTVIYVSHSMQSVKDICERAIYLKKGKVAFDGNVNEALEVYEKDRLAKKEKRARKREAIQEARHELQTKKAEQAAKESEKNT